MDYESASPRTYTPPHAHTLAHTAGGRLSHAAAATLEAHLLSYSENAENEGEEEEYLEEEVLQVRTHTKCLTNVTRKRKTKPRGNVRVPLVDFGLSAMIVTPIRT